MLIDRQERETANMGDVYERLSAALDRLANGFPRTAGGAEIRLLRKMFSGAEAAVAAALTATPQTSAVVAQRAGTAAGDARALLKALVKRDLVWLSTTPGWRGYRLAPFIVGSYEAHMSATRDPEYAALVEEYLTSGGAAAMMAPQPAIHRTVPARAALKEEWVLPYDDVRQILQGANAFRLEDCVCRVQQDQLGRRRCDFPVATCLWFSGGEPSAAQGTISREAALAFLDHAEQIGLVHTVSNATEGAGYVCNCCGCCCGLLRGITEWGIEHSVAQANYFAVIDAAACTDCGVCIERCQVHAISAAHDVPAIDLTLCIGCGLCVTGCGQDAVGLRRKPEDETVVPPVDFAAWERARLSDRGLSDRGLPKRGLPDSFVLSPFDQVDAAEVARWAASAAEAAQWGGSGLAWPVDAAVFAAWHADPDVRPYALRDAEGLVGYGEVWVDDEEREVELARIIVDPADRGQGVGRRLVTLLLEQAVLTGYADVFVRVVPENRRALACYLRAGFQQVSPAEQAQYNQGQPVAYIWLRRALLEDRPESQP